MLRGLLGCQARSLQPPGPAASSSLSAVEQKKVRSVAPPRPSSP